MAFDKSKFIEQFRTETREHLEKLSDGLLQLEKDPGKRDLLESMMREAHTIKGSATMMGYQGVADIAHGMEDGMEKALKGELKMDKPHFDLLFRCLDSMEPLLRNNEADEEREIEMPWVEELCREVEEIFAGKGLDLKKKGEAGKAAKGIKEKHSGEIAKNGGIVTPKKEKRGGSRPSRSEGSIRVDINKLDRLMNLSGEFGIARLRLKELAKNLIRKMERDARIPEEIQSLLWELKGVNEQIGSLTSVLQTETMNVRTVPVSHLFNTFPRAMRELASDKGKEVEFEIKGKETQLDKRIIDELRDPLMHLLRNAIDHGIEPPDERKRRKKEEKGRIVLKASQQGSQVVIEISDDGRGVDREKVKEKAVSKGLVASDEVEGLSDARVFQFLFTPGFSTMDCVTETSGRGVGLDVVKKSIDVLKGAIRIESEVGRGTRFTINLPLTLAIAESLLVASGSEIFALPMEHVLETVRIDPREIRSISAKEVVSVRGEVLPLLRLNRLFDLPMKGILEKRFFPVVIIHSMNRKVGLLVDRLLGHQEIIRKSLSYPLTRLRQFSGATILGSGRVTLIVNAPSLFEFLEERAYRTFETPPGVRPGKTVKKKRTILVAEDSPSTATLEKNILESVGYSVVLARDGREAFEKISQERFDLVITDVLMPRMDGFELTTRLKRDRTRQDIPIIIVTTRESDEDRRRGLEAGADAYMLKSEFTSEELLDTIERFVG